MRKGITLNIGFMGLGKLGLPVALAVEAHGHDVAGWDAVESVRDAIEKRDIRYDEQGAQKLLELSDIQLLEPAELVSWADLVFVCVQTPHKAEFEGITKLPRERADFDYSYLKDACKQLSAGSAVRYAHTGKRTTIVVVSTVLPGTMEREIVPHLAETVDLVYNPSFIAMGTTIRDYVDPEFVLVGSESPGALERVKLFYSTIHHADIVTVGIREAELAKVAYNVFLGMKLDFVNSMAMFCDVTGTDVDQVTEALTHAHRRLWSPETYWSAGMGDGGGCHPRDCIALSWLAKDKGLPYDLFEDVMLHREKHTEWIARKAIACTSPVTQGGPRRPIVLVGQSYKANSSLTIGSPAVLLKNLLLDEGVGCTTWDPNVSSDEPMPCMADAVYVIAANHDEFGGLTFPEGSTVVDPWGIVSDQDGVRVHRLGR